MQAGDTFTAPGFEEHLWVVISDPDLDPAPVVIVNLTTWREDKDGTCLIEAGEHPFVHQSTCVHYQGARGTTLSALTEALQRGLLRAHAPLGAELLARIRSGAVASPHMPAQLLQVLIDQGLIEE